MRVRGWTGVSGFQTFKLVFCVYTKLRWMVYEMNHIWTADMKPRRKKLWSSQLCTQFLQLRREAWKVQDFNGVWTRDLAIPVRRSNQLSYEATDVGSWSFVGSNGPERNESMMNGIWNESYMNCGYETKWSYDLCSYERNFCNCVEKPEKFSTSTGFEPGFSTQLQKLRSYMIHFIYHSSLIHSSRDH